MREILFRGKRKDNGEWVYGYYLFTEQNTHPVIIDLKCHSYIINPETVGQFTGLTDRNGNKIFEGDIVKQIYNGLAHIVTWDKMRALFYLESNSGIVGFYHCFGEELKIIGNIHDNPELLNATKTEGYAE